MGKPSAHIMTDKFFWSDPHLATFEAVTLTLSELGGKPSVVL